MALIRDTILLQPLIGTKGNDILVYSGAASFIDGGAGRDIVSINENSSSFSINTKKSGLTYLNEVSDRAFRYYGSISLKNVEMIEFLDKTIKIGHNAGGKKSGAGNPNDMNEITGTNRDDELTGTNGGDFLKGLGGDDRLYGGAGDDLISGGKGYDVMSGGSGEDWYAISKKLGKGLKNWDQIRDFEVGKDVIMVVGSRKGLWIDSYQGDAIVVSGKKDVIAWVQGAGGELEWSGSDRNLIL